MSLQSVSRPPAVQQSLYVRIHENKKAGCDSLTSRTRQHTPTSQLTMRSTNKQTDLVAFEKNWNEVIDTLENYQKRRVTSLRTKLS